MTQENETNEILGEVLFQFIPQGNYVKVIAVDPNTNTEIIMVGDRRYGKQTLERTALQKLRYVIRKNKKEN
jgi:predicted proteasome-type protease